VEVQPLSRRYYKIVASVVSQTPVITKFFAAVGYELKPLRYVQKPKRYELEE
jgi:hypothetical protein